MDRKSWLIEGYKTKEKHMTTVHDCLLKNDNCLVVCWYNHIVSKLFIISSLPHILYQDKEN